MAVNRVPLVVHTFVGKRFDDHGLDVDLLSELIAFKTLLTETAKELWRKNNPTRERLPKNFEDSLVLKFYEIKGGSTTVPLVREYYVDQPTLIEPAPDELDEAAVLVAGTIDALAASRSFPPNFPRTMFAYFADYGKKLAEDERIEIEVVREKPPFKVRYSSVERRRAVEYLEKGYEDAVELSGEIRAADLDGRSFALRLPDGSKVLGGFAEEQEAVLIEALREHERRRLHVKGRAKFFPDGKLKKIFAVSQLSIEPLQPADFDSTAKSVWQLAEEVTRSVPEEDWRQVPDDLSINLDHYLYGHAKKN